MQPGQEPARRDPIDSRAEISQAPHCCMHVNGVEWAMARRPAAATTNEYLANEFHMALFGKFWDRVAPPRQAIRLDAGRSAQIDDYVRGQVGTGGPGLAVAI